MKKIKANTQQPIFQEDERDKSSESLEKAFERIYRNAIISERIAIVSLILAVIVFVFKIINRYIE